ncbi:conjugal transfer protein, partial [Streptococcus pyogenes]
RVQSLEKRLEVYKDPEAMFTAQGSNAFTRNYRKTMTKDQKLQANIDRRDRLTQRLNELRGGIS